MIPRPKKVFAVPKRKTAILQFVGEDEHLTGEYWVRGAVAWPDRDIRPGRLPSGYILVAAISFETGDIMVFDQHSFVSIDPVLDNSQHIRAEGIAHFMNEAWSHYYCDYFFTMQSELVCDKYQRQVHDSKLISRSVQFVPVPWGPNVQDNEHALWSRLACFKLLYDKESPLTEAVRSRLADKAGYPCAEIIALATLCAGIESLPYRKPYKAPEEPDFF